MTKVKEEQEEYRRRLDRVWGSAPWLKAPQRKRYRVKVFKSGNSMALRLPAELGFQAGAEMELVAEDGPSFSFEPVVRPRRKFNVAKVWGSATGLELIKPGDRVFAERRLAWDDPESDEPPAEPT
jgi:antitoxin VapB